MDVAQKQEAIEHHYDVGNDFYALWLDARMVYSCALWSSDAYQESLETAQIAKLNWHLDNLSSGKAQHILDIGCGWGSLLQRHSERNPQASSVGLSLSSEQCEYVESKNIKDCQVYLNSWTEHEPERSYDGIVSVGAFEHFADSRMPSDKKLALYRDFFSRCSQWLAPAGNLSLQSIVYGSMDADDQNEFISNSVFPNSELPTVSEIIESSKDHFIIHEQRLDGQHYAQTCELWLQNLNRNKAEVIRAYGKGLYQHYKKYLQFSAFGFLSGKIDLARFAMTKK